MSGGARRPAVFLDRDGTINVEKDYLYRVEDFEFIPGAVEAIACIKSLQTGVIHPTINYETPDPDCDLDYVPNQSRETKPRTALSNSFGFGGPNGTLVFSAWKS